MKTRKIFIFCTGTCPRRHLDSSRLSRYFTLNRCSIANDEKEADHIIYVTCSVVKREEEECFRQIRKFSGCRGELIVTGCLPAMAPLRLREEFKGKLLATRDLDAIDAFFPDFRIKFSEVEDSNSIFYAPLSLSSRIHLLAKKLFFKYRLINRMVDSCFPLRKTNMVRREYNNLGAAFLRVSCGCLENCAYCSVRNAVGKLKSKPIEICLREYKNLLKLRYRKFVFVSDNLGIYGMDRSSSLSQLFRALSEADKGLEVRWALDHLHPNWLVKFKMDLLGLVRTGKVDSVMCPIQSGSERILRLMRRQYSVGEILPYFHQLRSANGKFRLLTYILVGFPGETESDFSATLRALGDIRFHRTVIFPYHDAYGSDASKMSGKISAGKIADRVHEAIDFLEREDLDWVCNDIESLRFRSHGGGVY